MNIFTVVIAVLGLMLLVRPYQYSVYLMICICVFGSTAAITAGNTSILAAHFTLLFFALRTFVKLGPMAFVTPFSPRSPGFILLIYGFFGLCTAVLCPHIFAGTTQIFSVGEERGVKIIDLAPLQFSSGNINQAAYLIGNLLAFACAFSLARRRGAYDIFFKALIAVAVLNIFMAFLDLFTWATGTSYLLSFMKTAKLAFLDDNEIGGLKRISGSFAETSAFSGFTLRVFGFCFSLWMDKIRPKLTGGLSIILFVLLLLSTSSTAYVGLASIMLIVIAGNIWAVAAKKAAPNRLITLFLIMLAAVGAAVLIAFLVPSIAKSVSNIADTVLFNKLTSDSGVERSMWNEQAMQNFFDTYGFGVGLGSTRASSSAVVLLSNVGVIGAVLYTLFVYECLQRDVRIDATPFEKAFIKACRIGVIATISAQLVAGTVIDIGILNALLFGVCAADVFTSRTVRSAYHAQTWATPLTRLRRPVADLAKKASPT